MTGGRCKRRRTTGEGADGGSGALEKNSASLRTCGDGTPPATSSVASGVDLYAQARKALTKRCPFDGDERAPGAGTLPSALAAILHRQTDGRRKLRKAQEDAAGKAAEPVRPMPASSVWEKTEEFFRPISLEDIDLLDHILPPNSCFYIPGVENVVEVVENDETVHAESPPLEEDVSLSLLEVKQGTNCSAMVVAQTMKADSEVTCMTTLPAEGAEVEDDKSLNWILACRQRFLLTSERPSKKRKLLGGDAGLKQMLRLPCIQEKAEAESPHCDICCSGESELNANRIRICDSCKVAVHQKCYGMREIPEGAWLCAWCKHVEAVGMKSENIVDANSDSITPCMLCPKAGGALKPVGGNFEGDGETKFVHLFCSLWAPEVYVEDVGAMEPVMNVGGVQECRRKLVCTLCKVGHGVCVRCSNGSCRTSLHPVCAREAKHQMEIWGKFGHDNVELRAFCSKHSSLPETDSIQNSEHPSCHTDDDVLMGKLLPKCVPIKRLPKLRLSCTSKDKVMAQDGTTNLASDKVAENDTKVDQESLVPEFELDVGASQSNMVFDGANASPNADVIRIFRKLIGSRKINVFNVASELGVSSASLESIMMGEGDSFPGELRLKVIQWLQNVVHVQPSTRQLKFRNGSAVASGSLVARADGPDATSIHGTDLPDSFKLPEIIDTLLVKSKPPTRTACDKNNAEDDHVLSSFGELLQQDNGEEFVDEIDGDFGEEMSGVGNCSLCSTHNEDCCRKEDGLAKMMLPKPTGFPDSDRSKEQLCEDKPEGSDFGGVSHRSNLVVKNDQCTGADFTELKRDGLAHRGDVDVPGESNVKHVACGSRIGIHPFILKRLTKLQNQWHVLCNDRNKESGSTGRRPMCNTTIVDQLSTAKKMKILELSPADEVEGELLYLQNLLLNKANSIMHSCEELICRIIPYLPKELDSLRNKRWDAVLVNQYLLEAKEAKRRGRKERRHKEAQDILAAAAAAAAVSRNSLPRKDATDGNSSRQQQNLLKISAESGRAASDFTPGPRLKESLSRSSSSKVSSDKHSMTLKFPDSAKENALICDVCRRTETIVNRIFVCSSCKVAVHLDCYRRIINPTGRWMCEFCEMSSQCQSPRSQQICSSEKPSFVTQCSLCGGDTGAFRKATNGEWVHALCAEWLLESTYRRGQENLIDGMDSVTKEKDLHTCYICQYRIGLCLKCCYGHCQTTFHPSCARSAGLFMNMKAIGGRFQHKAYCEKHSVEQREKADSQHGAEELKNIKQVRVELEKMRLLCERIIRREKLKRELVICLHGILASRRDCVAFSALVRSSVTPSVSSDSATTAVDNMSYSGAIHRSDDITVDSTVSGRKMFRLPLDVYRRTDDSSTSQLSMKRKTADRTIFSGKQLPRRPVTTFRNLGGEKKPKIKKGIERLPIEKVMTSYQASLQNLRLPKGYIYVPVGSFSKDDAAAHVSESCELQESGG